jgi:hypothetical protein
MVLQHRKLIMWLLAVALVAAQAILAVHDVLPEVHAHAADCQICAHGSAFGHALPVPPVVIHPRTPNKRVCFVYLNSTPSHRYRAPTARDPPDTFLIVNV